MEIDFDVTKCNGRQARLQVTRDGGRKQERRDGQAGTGLARQQGRNRAARRPDRNKTRTGWQDGRQEESNVKSIHKLLRTEQNPGDAASFLTITFFQQKETFSHSEYQIRRPGGRRPVTKEIQDKPNRA